MSSSIPPPLPPHPDDLYTPPQHLRVGKMARLVWSVVRLSTTTHDWAWCTVCKQWLRYHPNFSSQYLQLLYKHCKMAHFVHPDGQLRPAPPQQSRFHNNAQRQVLQAQERNNRDESLRQEFIGAMNNIVGETEQRRRELEMMTERRRREIEMMRVLGTRRAMERNLRAFQQANRASDITPIGSEEMEGWADRRTDVEMSSAPQPQPSQQVQVIQQRVPVLVQPQQPQPSQQVQLIQQQIPVHVQPQQHQTATHTEVRQQQPTESLQVQQQQPSSHMEVEQEPPTASMQIEQPQPSALTEVEQQSTAVGTQVEQEQPSADTGVQSKQPSAHGQGERQLTGTGIETRQKETVPPSDANNVVEKPMKRVLSSRNTSVPSSTPDNLGAQIIQSSSQRRTPQDAEATNMMDDAMVFVKMHLEPSDKVKRIAQRAQLLMSRGTNLYFKEATFQVPNTENQKMVIMTSGVADGDADSGRTNSDELYMRAWAHTQFFAAQMASFGYRFISSKMRRIRNTSEAPNLGDWLKLVQYMTVPGNDIPNGAVTLDDDEKAMVQRWISGNDAVRGDMAARGREATEVAGKAKKASVSTGRREKEEIMTKPKKPPTKKERVNVKKSKPIPVIDLT